MTAHGSAATRFRRALASGDPIIAKAALGELAKIRVSDALAVLLLHRGHKDFERLAVRLHAMLCREVRLTLAEAQLALVALQTLDSDGDAGIATLVSLFQRHGLHDAAEILDEH